MLSAKELMALTIEKGASDLHINPGRPPIGRLDGKLVPLVEEDLDESDTEALARELCDKCGLGALDARNWLYILVRPSAPK